MHKDPFCKNNLLTYIDNKINSETNSYLKKELNILRDNLEKWMISQGDFIPPNTDYYNNNKDLYNAGPMPLIYPTGTGKLDNIYCGEKYPNPSETNNKIVTNICNIFMKYKFNKSEILDDKSENLDKNKTETNKLSISRPLFVMIV